jgi:putative addiction module component (TIGR02574 family)
MTADAAATSCFRWHFTVGENSVIQTGRAGWKKPSAFRQALRLAVPARPTYSVGMSVATIRDEVLSLPALERARLAEMLWNSLLEPTLKAREAVWADESERRIDAFEAGQLQARDAKDIFAVLRKGK